MSTYRNETQDAIVTRLHLVSRPGDESLQIATNGLPTGGEDKSHTYIEKMLRREGIAATLAVTNAQSTELTGTARAEAGRTVSSSLVNTYVTVRGKANIEKAVAVLHERGYLTPDMAKGVSDEFAVAPRLHSRVGPLNNLAQGGFARG